PRHASNDVLQLAHAPTRRSSDLDPYWLRAPPMTNRGKTEMALSLHTKLCDMLGIEYPIMAFNHCRDVVAAVCNAGGSGVLGALRSEEHTAELQSRENLVCRHLLD